MPLDAAFPDIAYSVCPHDRPSAGPRPLPGGAVFHDTAVWISPAG